MYNKSWAYAALLQLVARHGLKLNAIVGTKWIWISKQFNQRETKFSELHFL